MSYPGTPSAQPHGGHPGHAPYGAYTPQMQHASLPQQSAFPQHQLTPGDYQHQPGLPIPHHPQQPQQHFVAPHAQQQQQQHPFSQQHPPMMMPQNQAQPFPGTPMAHRAIVPLPQHSRVHHLQQGQQQQRTPSSQSHSRPSNASAMQSAKHGRHGRSGEDSLSRKRARRLFGDGFEAPYLQPGPTNRLLLSLKSGLATQIDWALSRLAQASLAKHDLLLLEAVPGLAEILLSYPRRLCAAINAEPSQAWEGVEFEQCPHVNDAGIGAPGDGEGQGGASWHQSGEHVAHKPSLAESSRVRRRLLLMPSSTNVKRSRIGAMVVNTLNRSADDSDDDDEAEYESAETRGYRDYTFDPARVPEHAALMRRALEAALVLRNMTMNSNNARHLLTIRGVQTLIRNVLALPSMVLVREADASGQPMVESEEWLELEGVAELRLHFLDLLEGIAVRLHLSQRAQFSIAPPGLDGCSTVAKDRPQTDSEGRAVPIVPIPNVAGNLKAADEIFIQLLDMVHHSTDRAFLLGSLRCLTSMSASEKNEMAFIEADVTGGRQSPGLIHRCIELLPLTQDSELLEAVLDLLYQLICLGDNGLRLAKELPARALDSLEEKTPGSAAASSSARSFSRTFAAVRLLVRNLGIGKVVWERDHALAPHREWSYAVPGRAREAVRKERELRLARQTETAHDRARKKKLTWKERQAIIGLPEPERSISWMKTVFRANPTKEVTQMEFWTAYKDEFAQLAHFNQAAPLQQAARLIQSIPHVFPGASATVIPATATSQPRFVIGGLEVRERDLTEPFECGWRTCPQPETRTAEAQREHAQTHVRFNRDGRCRWRSCDFDVDDALGPDAATSSKELMEQCLWTHVLTHLPEVPARQQELVDSSGEASAAGSDKRATPNIVVDDNLRVVEGSRKTGEACAFETKTLPNGARYLVAAKKDGEDTSENGESPRKSLPLPTSQVGAKGDRLQSRKGRIEPSPVTVDNPGFLTFEVARTPSVGPDEHLLPQGIAYMSLLVLRMLTRNAGAVLDKAGLRRDSIAGNADRGDDGVAQTLRGEGDERFGLPLPRNFGSSSDARANRDNSSNGTGNSDGGGTKGARDWKVGAAQRLMDAMLGVEEELAMQSFQNDILCPYINETLVELRKRGVDERYGFEALLDPLAAEEGEEQGGPASAEAMQEA